MQWLQDFAEWLLDLLLFVPRWLWSQVLDALATFVESVPVPEAVSAWMTNAGSIPSTIVWFLTILEFKYGVSVIIAALVLRWQLRRIPFLGR